jgi:hypothetical protein
MLNVIMLSVVMWNVVMLNVVILNVTVPANFVIKRRLMLDETFKSVILPSSAFLQVFFIDLQL